MPDLRDLVDPAELIDVVRQLQFPRFTLSNVFPENTIDDTVYGFQKRTESVIRAASARTYDAEAAIGSRPGVARVTGQLPPISQKIVLTEGERLMLRNLLGGGNVSDEFIQEIFNDAARMVSAVQARVELARGDALTDGIVTIMGEEIEGGLTVDFGVPAGHKVVAAAVWTTTTTDIVTDVRNWVETYVDANGVPPGRAITSTRIISAMLRNESVQALIGDRPTLDNLNLAMQAEGFPTIERYDVQVVTPAGAQARVIPDDRFIMLPGTDGDVLGRTEYGITVEAMELVNEGLIPSEAAAGVVAVAWKTKDPVQIWTKGAAIALPLIVNPTLLFTADVAA